MEDLDCVLNEFEQTLIDVFGLEGRFHNLAIPYDRLDITLEDAQGYHINAVAYNYTYDLDYLDNYIYEEYLNKNFDDITPEDIRSIRKGDFVDWLYDKYEEAAIAAIEDDPSRCPHLEIYD